MRKYTILAVTVLAVFGLTACGDEDPTDIEEQEDEIVGTWVSQGDDLAPGLVLLFGTDSIIATFSADGTYDVLEYRTTEGVAGTLDYDGTYVVGAESEGEVRSITLDQNNPYEAIAEGIFQVTGSTMTYEVIQTEPSSGATAPTVQGGFGSTVANGAPTDLFVQEYDRRD